MLQLQTHEGGHDAPPVVDPDELVTRAKREFNPSHTFCLFSGGNDSTAVAHRMREHYDVLFHIDTGTALPGVMEHVQAVASLLGKELLVYSAAGAFERMVLGDEEWWSHYDAEATLRPSWTITQHEASLKEKYGQGSGVVRRGPHKGLNLGAFPHGFPGPAQHGRAYARLKERQIEALIRDHKTGRHDRILLLSGKRRTESERRSRTTMELERKGARVFACPLIDWTKADLIAYRLAHSLPEGDVAALMHRSGECNCGSFAAPGERQDIQQFYPEWFEESVARLERRAEALGIAGARWGDRPRERAVGPAGALCSDCQLRFEGP